MLPKLSLPMRRDVSVSESTGDIDMKNYKCRWLVAGACLIAVVSMANVGWAALYTSTDDKLPSPHYYGMNPVNYSTPGGVYHIDSFFDVFTEIERVPAPTTPGATEVHSFFDVFTEFDLSVQGVLGPVHIRESPSKASMGMRLNGLPPGTPVIGTRVFDTEMLSLEIGGSGSPGGLPPGVMIRESPTLASTGKTSITDLGGGNFRIGSFFDVFTELSLDGGQSWNPSAGPLHLEAAAVPELSSCLVWLVGSIAMGYFGYRRARV